MGKIVRHYELPVASTDTITEASLSLYGNKALIRFDYYRDGKAQKSGLYFTGVASTQSRSERCSTSWHIKAFDVLLEVVDSHWVKTQREEMAERHRREFTARHYVFYFDSVGCFEILAENFEVIPEEPGSWAGLNGVLMPV